ncbi:MAG: ftsY [Acidobacteria bacterium]|nr:ftsY [Acidobacteriota bacterium]
MMLFSRSSKDSAEKKPGLFERMKRALGATKQNLVGRIESVLTGRTAIDEGLFEELEGVLLGADLGVKSTAQIMNFIRDQQKKHLVNSAAEVRAAIRSQLIAILKSKQKEPPEQAKPAQAVWMIVGVNGTGKTTTVGKLAARCAQDGMRVLVCAADTFRPAAIEQLAIWAERSGAELVKSKIGADPSSVLHDALAAAEARKCDLVLVDAQAREFLKSAGVTGLIVTKLDGTAKGGVLFSIAQEMNIPVRYIGVGESLEDLLEFSPENFVESLFS